MLTSKDSLLYTAFMKRAGSLSRFSFKIDAKYRNCDSVRSCRTFRRRLIVCTICFSCKVDVCSELKPDSMAACTERGKDSCQSKGMSHERLED